MTATPASSARKPRLTNSKSQIAVPYVNPAAQVGLHREWVAQGMGCTGNGLHKEWAALMACAQRARVDAAPGELGWQQQQATKMGGHAQQAAAHEVHLCGQSASTPQRVALTQDGAHQGAHQHRGNNHDRVVGRETLQQRDAQTFMLMVALLV